MEPDDLDVVMGQLLDEFEWEAEVDRAFVRVQTEKIVNGVFDEPTVEITLEHDYQHFISICADEHFITLIEQFVGDD
jgi:hypothetical protein